MRNSSVLIGVLCAASLLTTTASASEVEAETPSTQVEKKDSALEKYVGQISSGIASGFAEFNVNAHRFDPYKRINFRVRWDGRIIPGVSYVSPISRHTSVVKHRSGAEASNHRLAPGSTTMSPITLKRGVTHDTAFEEWSEKVWSPIGPAAMSLKDYRKDILIELLNLQGNVVKSYRLYRCWPSDYVPLAVLDAGADLVAEETLTIQCENWERDKDIAEPTEH